MRSAALRVRGGAAVSGSRLTAGYPLFTCGAASRLRSKNLFERRWIHRRHRGIELRRYLVPIPVDLIDLALLEFDLFSLHGEGDEIGGRWRDGGGGSRWGQAGPIGDALYHQG